MHTNILKDKKEIFGRKGFKFLRSRTALVEKFAKTLITGEYAMRPACRGLKLIQSHKRDIVLPAKKLDGPPAFWKRRLSLVGQKPMSGKGKQCLKKCTLHQPGKGAELTV